MTKILLSRCLPYFFIAIISVVVVWDSCFLYSHYYAFRLPVYDGVMYEKQQIIRYLNFKGNFSFLECYNQFVYELMGSPVGGGFTAITCLINPKWLNSGFNISLRSVFCFYFFLLSIYKWLSLYINPLGLWLILILITQFPLLYHYRFGLASYVPDLSAGLSLAAAFIFTWLVLNRKVSRMYLFLIPILISVGLFSRYNFFVYSVLLFLPFLMPLIKFCRQLKSKRFILLLSIYLLFFVIIWILYAKMHFHFFLHYYAKPAEFQHVDYSTSFYSLINYLKCEFSWFGLTWIALITIVFVNTKKEDLTEEVKSNLIVMYPAIILFFFLFVLLKATNQPHVFSAFFVFVFLAFLALLVAHRSRRFLAININEIFIKLCVIGMVIWNQLNWREKVKFNGLDSASNLNFKLANVLSKNIKPGEKYFLTHDAMLEIPIDVYIYRNKGYWLNNDLMFYLTDWNYYEISSKLDIEEIILYYKRRLSDESVKYITLPKRIPSNKLAKALLHDISEWARLNQFQKSNFDNSSNFELYHSDK